MDKYIEFRTAMSAVFRFNPIEENSEEYQKLYAEKKYAIKTRLSDLSKIIPIYLLLYLLGFKYEMPLIVLIVLTYKPFTYGYHFQKHLDCFVWGAFLYVIGILLISRFDVNMIMLFPLYIWSSYQLYTHAPVSTQIIFSDKTSDFLMKNALIIHNVYFIIAALYPGFVRNVISCAVIIAVISITPTFYKFTERRNRNVQKDEEI